MSRFKSTTLKRDIPSAFQELPATLLTIVLGPQGRGAFGNDSREMAELFHRALEQNFKGSCRRVVFAIVDRSRDRRFIGPFQEAFRMDRHAAEGLRHIHHTGGLTDSSSYENLSKRRCTGGDNSRI
jgi:hypothetical protein